MAESKKPEANGANGSEATGFTPEGEEVDFAKVSIREAFSLLNASEQGLTAAEAAKRLEEYGPNKLPESSINPFVRFLGYLWNPLSWAMEVAAILAIILLDYADFALIVALLLLNATISFVEESNADKAIKALTSALAPKCKCLRDGKVSTMESSELVPGDVIVVKFGDVVPADMKLLGDEDGEDDQPMLIDQAALTGESLPVKKFMGDVAFSGSTCKQGEKHCLVYATGMNTFFGRAAALIGSTNNVANIQKIMTRIGAMCLITIGIWCVIELAVQFGKYGHFCSLGEEKCPTLTNMLVIIVGGIPIAMPTVLSVTLALGAYQLAKEGAIVARMSAVEEMAGMDILCSDKTGTLTLNKLSIETNSIYTLGNCTPQELLKWGALSANIITEEAIDVVLHNSYDGAASLWDHWKLLKYVPFNPTDKFTMATVQEVATGRKVRIMKGAPQAVIKRAHNFEAIKDAAEEKTKEYANRGFRALGFGLAEGEGAPDAPGTHWEFLGLVPLFDPPRHDTKETIERCQEKGIAVKMVTGDQQLIGIETARQLGMGTNIHKIGVLLAAKSGSGLVDGAANVDELVVRADGFAEVFPEHKFEIVKILQDRGHMVGMTGDGVNDAPALKKADVGIAVHGATDAARGAADIVLTEPGLSVIVAAVIGARKIFQRMTTYAKYTVAMTFRICFTFGLLTVIYNWYFPTILIVLLAVFNDGAMIALSKDRVVPSPTPNTWRLRNIFITGIVYGLYLTLSTWALYHIVSKTDFTSSKLHGYSLEDDEGALSSFCTNQMIPLTGRSPDAPATVLYGAGAFKGNPVPTLLQQCIAEQRYVRGAQLRSLIYLHVSISGQALVFVTRTLSHSFLARAGGLTYLAFFAAQAAATLIAAFGFNGYPVPADEWRVDNCQLCLNSQLNSVQFFPNHAPIANTEGVFTSSAIGCTYYIVLAWIWSLIWHLGLDPLKWLMAWILNEEGMRNRHAWKQWIRSKPRAPVKTGEETTVTVGGAAAGYTNPLGRASIIKRPSQEMIRRASMVAVERAPTTGLRRVSANPYQRTSGGTEGLAAGANPTLASPNPLRRFSVGSPSHSAGAGGAGAGGNVGRVSAGAVKRSSLPV